MYNIHVDRMYPPILLQLIYPTISKTVCIVNICLLLYASCFCYI